MIRLLLVTTALLCLTASAFGDPRESVAFTVVPSNGGQSHPANAIRTFQAAGGYTLGRIEFSGTLSSVNAATRLLDARLLVTAPNGESFVFQPFVDSETFTFRDFEASRYAPTVNDPAGQWSFRFFELIDNGGTGQVDALWNLTVTFTDEPALPPSATDLGTMTSAGASQSTFMPVRSVMWYRFTLPCAIDGALGTYLDVDLATSNVGGTTLPNDTQLAVYDAAGVLVAFDDDSGPNVTAQLSFGGGVRPPNLDGQPFDGTNGPLAAGDYYLAACSFSTDFGALIWNAVSNSAGAGILNTRILTNIGAGPGPGIAGQPSELGIVSGTPASFEVAASGPGPFSYQWRRDGTPLEDGVAPGGGIISGANSATLTIDPATEADAGLYDVIVANGCNQVVSDAAALFVSPRCDADLNCDGSPDQGDVACIIFAVAGDTSCICQDPDFNLDGSADQGDIAAVISVVAGGPCP